MVSLVCLVLLLVIILSVVVFLTDCYVRSAFFLCFVALQCSCYRFVFLSLVVFVSQFILFAFVVFVLFECSCLCFHSVVLVV